MGTTGKIFRFSILALAVLLLVAGCGGKNKTAYKGERYKKTSTVIPSFQPDQVPVSCTVFAHLLIWLPKDYNGQTIAQAAEKEAGKRGADMLLIGGSRMAEDDEGLNFAYYGPRQPYNCRDHWAGWKFGYDVWADQGEWVTMGYKEWGNAGISFDFPIVMQAALLRCKQ